MTSKKSIKIVLLLLGLNIFFIFQNLDFLPKSRIFFVSELADIEQAIAEVGEHIPATIVIDKSVQLSRSLIVPNHISLEIKGGGGIALNNFKLTVLGPLIAGRRKIFSYSPANGESETVVFGRFQESVYPEWYGAVADATGAVQRTNWKFAVVSTQALQKSLNAKNVDFRPVPVSLGLGGYVTGALTIPAEQTLRGISHIQSFLVAAPNIASGPVITDQGNAAKIIIENLSVYGNMAPQITALVRLGYNGIQWGTQGYIRNLWVRDAPNGYGVDVNGNVAFLDTVISEFTKHGIKIEGHANMARNLCIFHLTQAYSIGFEMRYGSVDGMEIEAPPTDSLPIYLTGNAFLRGVTISFDNSTTTQFSHLIEIGLTSNIWAVEGVSFINRKNARLKGALYKVKGALTGGKNITDISRFNPTTSY